MGALILHYASICLLQFALGVSAGAELGNGPAAKWLSRLCAAGGWIMFAAAWTASKIGC